MAPEPTLGFSRAQRITRRSDIERLLRSGQRLQARTFDVKQLESAQGTVRVAIVVPKFGFTAVQRNRLKRRMRELARQHLLPLPGSNDVLLRARREAYALPFDAMREEIRRVAAQLA